MDNDIYGHINNAVHYSYFDTAVNRYLIDTGVLDLRNSTVVGLVVETGCSYFKEIAFPDPIWAGVRVTHIGKSSVKYEVALFPNNDELASAQGQFVHVYVDRVTRRPVEIPLEMKKSLAAIVNHPD